MSMLCDYKNSNKSQYSGHQSKSSVNTIQFSFFNLTCDVIAHSVFNVRDLYNLFFLNPFQLLKSFFP